YISPSYGRPYPLVAEKGRGCMVTDPDGNVFLDFAAGIATVSTGHCHPDVIEAIKKQAEKLIHISGTDFYYEPQVELARELDRIVPGDFDKKVFFTNSGAESIEGAMKLARYYTGRQFFVSFFGSFHGRTMGSLSLTASKYVQRKGFAPLIPSTFQTPYSYCYRCEFGGCSGECYCLDFLENHYFKQVVPPEEIAAIFVEPIQGEGGYIMARDEFLPRLASICKEHGILLVVDEIQSGMGRTGKMFAIEHWGVVPDITCIAKGIASGMPIGAFVASSEIMSSWGPGAHANTFGGNPISCKAALATINLLEKGLIENAGKQGEYLSSKLCNLMDKYDIIGEVRGKGLMIGMEIVRDRESKKAVPELRDRIVEECFKKGLLVLGCGESTIRFSPPLVVTRNQCDVAVSIVDSVLGRVKSG
ncbi:MAG: acetyl ornithine aminotransferase family protein, partial [Candidatus Eremiobacteraeota bacterium]|nr:acetyl ornithine aminotransferase family protein [Candidatus Eremiobacteraeota bacterium]